MRGMKLTLFRSIRPPSQVAEEAEVDVTPVMNVFIILIPFLVSMAVFTRVSIIEFSLPPNVGAQMNNDAVKPTPKLTVRIGNDYLAIVLGESMLDSLVVENGQLPLVELGKRIKAHQTSLDYTDEVVIASLDRIAFKHVVAVMDLCRAAGLAKIGLSSATEEPGDVP